MGIKEATRQKAVIYARVSGAKQVREGDGLKSQETRCREYARYKAYDVAEVFTDDMTGKATARPGMQSMLGYLHMNAGKGGKIVVIIDDISRLARGLTAHLELRQSLAQAGGKLESPSIEFGEDSDSILVENLLASVAQHQREKNGEQTANRMRGRLLNGYAVFPAPIGYRYERRSGQGKVLVRDEPFAAIVTEALEGYASGRFASQAEVKRFLEAQPAWPKDLPGGLIRQQRVTDLLSRVLYAGYVEHAPWNVPRSKGHHEALIALATFERIQARRNDRALAPTRKDIHVDFPLRGAVACSDCGRPFCACWSTSKTGKRHPYYWCQEPSCARYRKSIRRDEIDGGFEVLLRGLQPTANLMKTLGAMFRDAWSQRQTQFETARRQIERDIAAIEKQSGALLDRIVLTESAAVAAAYEKRIAGLEGERQLLVERLDQQVRPLGSFDEIYELAMTFLSSPWNIWKNGALPLRRTVLRLAFRAPLAYHPETGFRTPEVSVPFTLIGAISQKCRMVRWGGFEPPTP